MIESTVETFTPPATWDELVTIEHGLERVARMIGYLAPLKGWDGGLRYIAIRDYASLLVGWERGGQAHDGGSWDCTHAKDRYGRHAEFGSHALSELKPDLESPPLTDTERWLRSSAAYDLALDHLIGLLEARGMA